VTKQNGKRGTLRGAPDFSGAKTTAKRCGFVIFCLFLLHNHTVYIFTLQNDWSTNKNTGRMESCELKLQATDSYEFFVTTAMYTIVTLQLIGFHCTAVLCFTWMVWLRLSIRKSSSRIIQPANQKIDQKCTCMPCKNMLQAL
jgi:hypothetical protein